MVADTVGAAGLVVRLLPSIAARSIGTAAAGTTINVLERDGDWVKVEWQNAGVAVQRRRVAIVGKGGEEDGCGWVLARKGHRQFARPRSVEELREVGIHVALIPTLQLQNFLQ